MNISNKNKDTERLYGFIEDCEKKENIDQRAEALSLLKESFSLYKKICREKGKMYCNKKLPDVPKRMNDLTERLIEYKS